MRVSAIRESLSSDFLKSERINRVNERMDFNSSPMNYIQMFNSWGWNRRECSWFRNMMAKLVQPAL
ncbi:hypothetical protein CKQ80_20505 [Pseudomonas moraviensis]|uniref:Uncharacterized protein n=1 Tax=Pseudomonas moraviensis TaxID=321662 RepID=A0A2A2PQU3_9PSED|nr:hypothetical protein CKQ68_08705 [Pseudomonas moraviensis]PAW57575.1 hypothetical protein CKQ80_20505 [Pseudomonas moraviensis]